MANKAPPTTAPADLPAGAQGIAHFPACCYLRRLQSGDRTRHFRLGAQHIYGVFSADGELLFATPDIPTAQDEARLNDMPLCYAH